MSISRLPPRTFWPFASSGSMMRELRQATPPACHTHVMITMPLSAKRSEKTFPTSARFQAMACSYEVAMPGMRPMFSSGTSPPA